MYPTFIIYISTILRLRIMLSVSIFILFTLSDLSRVLVLFCFDPWGSYFVLVCMVLFNIWFLISFFFLLILFLMLRGLWIEMIRCVCVCVGGGDIFSCFCSVVEWVWLILDREKAWVWLRVVRLCFGFHCLFWCLVLNLWFEFFSSYLFWELLDGSTCDLCNFPLIFILVGFK